MVDITLEFKAALLLFCLGAGWIFELIAPLQAASRQRLAAHLRHDVLNLLLAAVAALANSAIVIVLLLPAFHLVAENQWGALNWLDAPVWVTWLLALVLFDLWQYGWHVLNHRLPWLWRFHVVHHADTAMDSSTGLRFHVVEIALSTLARLPVVLILGMQLQHLLVYQLLALPIVLFHHSNLRLPLLLDQVLRAMIVTPRMHWVHHSNIRVETDSNYSSVLSVWDRLFGSYRRRDNFFDLQLGVQGVRYESLGDMLLGPLRHGGRAEVQAESDKKKQV